MSTINIGTPFELLGDVPEAIVEIPAEVPRSLRDSITMSEDAFLQALENENPLVDIQDLLANHESTSSGSSISPMVSRISNFRVARLPRSRAIMKPTGRRQMNKRRKPQTNSPLRKQLELATLEDSLVRSVVKLKITERPDAETDTAKDVSDNISSDSGNSIQQTPDMVGQPPKAYPPSLYGSRIVGGQRADTPRRTVVQKRTADSAPSMTPRASTPTKLGLISEVGVPLSFVNQRARYVQGPIRLLTPITQSRSGSIANMELFHGLLGSQDDMTIGKTTEESIVDDMVDFFESFGFAPVQYGGDNFWEPPPDRSMLPLPMPSPLAATLVLGKGEGRKPSSVRPIPNRQPNGHVLTGKAKFKRIFSTASSLL